MPIQRIKGQETVITIVANGDVQSRITAIKDLEAIFELEVKTENYLGETAPRHDMIYMGTSFKITGHLENRSFFDLCQTIIGRARRNLGPGTRIDCGTTFRFDNGELVTVIFPELQFASIPLNFGARDEYGEFTLDAKGSEFTIVG